jgi:ATP/maltotriose-dependent transcriptional regulator MalT
LSNFSAIAVIDWETLRLSEAETAALIRSRSSFDAQTVASLHARAGGWVAGARLLLERLDAKSAGPALHRPEALESAFNYFAAEIFDAAPEALRQALLRTACVPRFSAALAVKITGDPQAGRRIEELYRRRLFVDRRSGLETTSQSCQPAQQNCCSRLDLTKMHSNCSCRRTIGRGQNAFCWTTHAT